MTQVSMLKPLTRRQLLQAGLCLSSLYLPLVNATQTSDVARLIDLSAFLTGRARSDFLEDTAARLFEFLVSRGDMAALKDLMAKPIKDSSLASELVEAWYTGQIRGNQGAIVVTYNNALVWQSASFLHPMGNCAGPTNYWSKPPSI